MFLITVENALRETLWDLTKSFTDCESYADNAVTAENISTVTGIVHILCKSQLSFEVQPWD